MNDQIGHLVLGQVGEVGWDSLVESMRGAIADRSHVTHLGYVIGIVLVVWINWRVAKWILRHLSMNDQ
jgi:hypothetical protein